MGGLAEHLLDFSNPWQWIAVAEAIAIVWLAKWLRSEIKGRREDMREQFKNLGGGDVLQ